MDFNKIKEALDEMIKNLEKEDEEVVKSSKNAKKNKSIINGTDCGNDRIIYN